MDGFLPVPKTSFAFLNLKYLPVGAFCRSIILEYHKFSDLNPNENLLQDMKTDKLAEI